MGQSNLRVVVGQHTGFQYIVFKQNGRVRVKCHCLSTWTTCKDRFETLESAMQKIHEHESILDQCGRSNWF
jgi:hypothetical protein